MGIPREGQRRSGSGGAGVVRRGGAAGDTTASEAAELGSSSRTCNPLHTGPCCKPELVQCTSDGEAGNRGKEGRESESLTNASNSAVQRYEIRDFTIDKLTHMPPYAPAMVPNSAQMPLPVAYALYVVDALDCTVIRPNPLQLETFGR